MPPTLPQETPVGTPAAYSAQRELSTLLTSAATSPLAQTAWVRVTGSDRVRWLNGMVTNSIQGLTPGDGSYNLLLNAQGRIQGDANIFAEPGDLLLQTSADQLPTLLTLLDRFIIMDDVELTDISADRSGLLLAGPHAPELLREIHLLPPDRPTPSLTRLQHVDDDVLVLHAHSPLTPRFELWTSAPGLAQLASRLQQLGAISAGSQAIDLLRTLEGTPLFGTDIRDRDLPQETGAHRALHFSKGCYLGQEIVERIRSRGQVHRTFGGFTLSGAPATPVTALTVEGKPAGELTSAATLATSSGPVHLALGYIRREFLVGNRTIHYPGGTARPTSLPFDPGKIL